MMNEIVVEIRAVANQKVNKAVASVSFDTNFGELTIARIKILQMEDDNPWIEFPTIDFPDKQTGEFIHLKIVKPGARLKKAISDAILEEYKKLM